MENILQNLLNKDFNAFKEGVKSALLSKIASKIEEAKSDIFAESKEDAEYKEKVNHADKDGYKEDIKSASDDDEEEPQGGEFLVDLKFIEGNDTELKNFRVAAVSKKDVESRLNGFFGKGKFEVQSIKVNEEVVDHIEEQRFEKGEDIGKPGLNFKKVAAKAAKQYGSEEAGKRVAGAVLKKILKKKSNVAESVDHENKTKIVLPKKDIKLKVGDPAHIGMKNKGGFGVHGHVTKIDGDVVYVESPHSEISALTNEPYKKSYRGALKNASKMKPDFSDYANESYDIKSDDKSSEYETHYESFQDALEAAKKHATGKGYKHNSKEFEAMSNKGYIKSKESKTHAFHMSLTDNYGNELKKIHSFQITGKGDGKFYLNQDIK